jgi:hypothetical protein
VTLDDVVEHVRPLDNNLTSRCRWTSRTARARPADAARAVSAARMFASGSLPVLDADQERERAD